MKIQYAEKVDRLVAERNRIIAEHDTGSILIVDGNIQNAQATRSGEVAKPSDSAAKVSSITNTNNSF